MYSLSQTKRSLCESSKNTKKKRKADKNQKPTLIRALTQTHRYTHFTSISLTQRIFLQNSTQTLDTFFFFNTIYSTKWLWLGSGLKVYSLVQECSCTATHIGAHLGEKEKKIEGARFDELHANEM